MSTIVVRRTAAIGDCIVATTVADALIDAGHEVVFQCHRRIMPVIQRHPRISKVTERDAACQVDLDGVYENSILKKTLSLERMFIAHASAQLLPLGIHLDTRHREPVLCAPEASRTSFHQRNHHLTTPWVFICPRSEDYNVRSVPDTTWQAAAVDIPGTKFWLGRGPAPIGIVDLHVQTITQVMDSLAAADLLLTTDTGPAHIAAAFGIPMVVISQAVNPALRLSETAQYECVSPDGLHCLNCQLWECPINRFIPPCQKVDAKKIALAAQKMLTEAKVMG